MNRYKLKLSWKRYKDNHAVEEVLARDETHAVVKGYNLFGTFKLEENDIILHYMRSPDHVELMK